LVISQTKRTQAIDNTIAAGAQLDVLLNTAAEPCNVHGLIIDLWVGQQVVTFHDFGYWAVTILPRTTTSVPVLNTSNVNQEKDSAVMWMLGTWMVVDTDRAHIGGAPRTSRNCNRGARMFISIANSSVSAGSVRAHGVATWFETIK